MKKEVLLGAVIALLSNAAYALESFEGKVMAVEPSYMPGTVSFVMSAGNVACPAGKWLIWQNADPENNKAVYATLMSALAADKNVRFHINDGDTACHGKYLHLIK